MKRFVIEGNGTKELPQWLRTSFVDDEGTVYLPCAVFDNENAAYMCMAFDGVGAVRDKKHAYGPAWWLINEYPKHKKAIEVMRDRVQKETVKVSA